MKTFKQSITENQSAEELYNIKLSLNEWWKKNSKNPEFKENKAEMDKEFNKVLVSLERVVEIVYGDE